MPPNLDSSTPHGRERMTSLRYSLANENIGSHDELINHPSGQVRLIRYPTPSPEGLLVRQQLIDRGLILGALQTGSEEAEQAFVVPLSARPIGYDAGQRLEGAFTYADQQMFHDLGDMLGVLSRLQTRQFALKGDIGRLIVLVEFRRPNERQLYFVPGVEVMKRAQPLDTPPLDYYCGRLESQFGKRFAEVTRYFSQGFLSGQEGN